MSCVGITMQFQEAYRTAQASGLVLYFDFKAMQWYAARIAYGDVAAFAPSLPVNEIRRLFYYACRCRAEKVNAMEYL